MIVHDEGQGVTRESVKLLEDFLRAHPDFSPIEAHVYAHMNFGFELYGTISRHPVGSDEYTETVYVLLSGFNCGYGGTGPHGVIEAVKLLGYEMTPDQRAILFGNRSVEIDFRGLEMKVTGK